MATLGRHRTTDLPPGVGRDFDRAPDGPATGRPRASIGPPCPRPPTVFVRDDGQEVEVDGLDDEGVLAPLRSVHHRADPRRGGQVRRVVEPLYETSCDHRGRPLHRHRAGLAAASASLLARAGYRPEPERHRGPLGEPDLAQPEGTGPVDEAMLSAVGMQDRGLIRYDGRRVDPVRLAEQVALAFPSRRVAVLAARVDDVRSIAARLRRVIPGTAWMTCASPWSQVGQTLVATPWSLGELSSRHWELDVVLYVDAREALGLKPQDALRACTRARVFGLLDASRPIAPRDEDELRATFGFGDIVVPAHGRVERTVRAVCRRIRGGPPPGLDLDPVDLKRRGLWLHPVRNRVVARVAKALASGDPSSIAAELPSSSRLVPGGGERRVAVLVESLEHALALAARLPGWPLLVGEEVDERGLSAAERRLLSTRRPVGSAASSTTRTIATFGGIRSLDVGGLDALVRADGGVGVPDLEAFRPVTRNRFSGPLLLVDLDDRHHPELMRRSRGRVDAYRRLGWLDAERRGLDAIFGGAVTRFLDARPGGCR